MPPIAKLKSLLHSSVVVPEGWNKYNNTQEMETSSSTLHGVCISMLESIYVTLCGAVGEGAMYAAGHVLTG